MYLFTFFLICLCICILFCFLFVFFPTLFSIFYKKISPHLPCSYEPSRTQMWAPGHVCGWWLHLLFTSIQRCLRRVSICESHTHTLPVNVKMNTTVTTSHTSIYQLNENYMHKCTNAQRCSSVTSIAFACCIILFFRL